MAHLLWILNHAPQIILVAALIDLVVWGTILGFVWHRRRERVRSGSPD